MPLENAHAFNEGKRKDAQFNFGDELEYTNTSPLLSPLSAPQGERKNLPEELGTLQ